MKNRRLCRGQNIKTNSMKKIIALLLFAQSLFAQEKPINELLDKTSPAYGGATSVLDVGQMMGESFLIEKFQYFQSNPEDNIILYGSLLPQIKNGCYQTSAFIRVNKNLSVGFCAYICPDDKKAEVAIVKKTGGDNYECEYSKREKRRIHFLKSLILMMDQKLSLRIKFTFILFFHLVLTKKGYLFFKTNITLPAKNRFF